MLREKIRWGKRREQTDRQELAVSGRTVRKDLAKEMIFEERPEGREESMKLGTGEGHWGTRRSTHQPQGPSKPRYSPLPTAPPPKPNPALTPKGLLVVPPLSPGIAQCPWYPLPLQWDNAEATFREALG